MIKYFGQHFIKIIQNLKIKIILHQNPATNLVYSGFLIIIYPK